MVVDARVVTAIVGRRDHASFGDASPWSSPTYLLISLDVWWRVYRGYQRGISLGSSRHNPGRGSTRSADPLATCCFGWRCDVLLGCSFGIDRRRVVTSRRVLLLQPVVCSPRLLASRRRLCVLSFRPAAVGGSFFRALPPPPPLVFFPLSRNDRTPFVCDVSAFMFSWYRGGRTRRTLLLRSARSVLVAPSPTPMPLSRRSTTSNPATFVPRRPPASPGVHRAVTRPSFSLVAALFLLRFPRSSCDHARCAPMLPRTARCFLGPIERARRWRSGCLLYRLLMPWSDVPRCRRARSRSTFAFAVFLLTIGFVSYLRTLPASCPVILRVSKNERTWNFRVSPLEFQSLPLPVKQFAIKFCGTLSVTQSRCLWVFEEEVKLMKSVRSVLLWMDW